MRGDARERGGAPAASGGARPEAGRRRARAPEPGAIWAALNERQRAYLREAFALDQDAEEANRIARVRGLFYQPPASEWRWLPYGYVHGLDDPSGLALRLRRAGVERTDRVDHGTGSTWRALARRGLIDTRYVPHPLTGTLLLEVQLTRLGRRVMRAVEPSLSVQRRPKGTLSEWQWRTLARVSAAGPEGIPYQGWGFPGISEGTLRWLEERRDGALVEEIDPQTGRRPWLGSRDRAVLRLTERGRRFYVERHAQHRALYPAVEAPAPGDDG